MKEETTICQRLTEEGADSIMLEQYQYYQETGNMQGQYGVVCRFRREKSTFGSGNTDPFDYHNCHNPVLEGDKDSRQCGKAKRWSVFHGLSG